MNQKLKDQLIALADKYETKDFIKNDPSKFMHQVKDVGNQEIVAFLAASLAFGRREQILSHIQKILDNSGNDIKKWILDGKFNDFFPNDEKSFYRTYSNAAMISFFDTLRNILLKENEKTFGEYVKVMHTDGKFLHLTIESLFPKECTLIPHSEDSAAKKINMFLRWMCRTNSCVDLGIWTWYDKKNLLIPLDTHVMQEATKFSLIEPASSGKPKSASLKTAIELTKKLGEVFPDDPARGDFALFGLGVN